MAEVLRNYQEAAVNAIFDYFVRNRGNPIVAMPTGTGKSHVIAEFVRRVYAWYPWQRVMMVTHVKELIGQNYLKLTGHWPMAPAGIYSAGLKKKEAHFPITFAGIASIAKKAALFGHVDLLLIDECHLISDKEDTMYQILIKALLAVNPHLKVIGFTATPYRMGLGLLTEGGLFTDICFDITDMASFNYLVSQGWLAPLIAKKTKMEYDLSEVHTRGGEYVENELQAAVDKEELTYTAIRETLEYGHDRNCWLMFASGIQHALHIGQALDYYGVSNVVIHSKMKDEERDLNIAKFKSGEVRAAVNNGVLTTGFDHPPIDLIGVYRATKSAGLWVQMLGRGTRPCEGKENTLVMDFAGNTRRLGPINDPVIPKQKGKGGGEAPVKICEVCGTYIHASLTECPHCGNEFPRHLKIQETAGTEEVMAFTAPQYEIFKVDRVVYAEHRKDGKPPSIQVSYYCGLRMFKEWVCIEHPGYPGKQAREWWRKAAGTEPPPNTAEGLAHLDLLHEPVFIKVWINKKYPEIVAYDYTGETFGDQDARSPEPAFAN